MRAISDERWMDLALAAAARAGHAGDVPIGAVLVHEDEVLAISGNRREQDSDPTGHAEVLVLREGGRKLGSWRLQDCTLYVTLEPCPMCMGAAVNARVGRLVFATRDPKAGAAVSCYQLGTDEQLNHRLVITEGVRAHAASAMLSRFFASLRVGGRDIAWQPSEGADLDLGAAAPSLERSPLVALHVSADHRQE